MAETTTITKPSPIIEASLTNFLKHIDKLSKGAVPSTFAGIDTTALPNPYPGASGRNAGSYTWGAIDISRNASSESFEFFNQNGLAGIETSAYVSRLLPLKPTL